MASHKVGREMPTCLALVHNLRYTDLPHFLPEMMGSGWWGCCRLGGRAAEVGVGGQGSPGHCVIHWETCVYG